MLSQEFTSLFAKEFIDFFPADTPSEILIYLDSFLFHGMGYYYGRVKSATLNLNCIQILSEFQRQKIKNIYFSRFLFIIP